MKHISKVGFKGYVPLFGKQILEHVFKEIKGKPFKIALVNGKLKKQLKK